MKTYKEFISEIYYKPTDTLPSSYTPIQKAKAKYLKDRSAFKSGENKTMKNARRIIRQKKAIDSHGAVRRGAESPNFNLEPHRNIRIRGDREDYMTVHHPDSGVTFDAARTGRYLNGKPVYTVDWRHNHNKDQMNHQERTRLVRQVGKIWDKYVAPRFPNNTVLSNMPTSDSRERLYKSKGGFGSVDPVSRRQLAQVNRNPSPRQKAKGKKRTSPIEGPQQLRRWL